MALTQYRIPAFYGLNQGVSENGVPAGESPDARNMDTRGGRLAVAKGYVRHSSVPHPAPADVLRLHAKTDGGGTSFTAVSRTEVRHLAHGDASWRTLFTFSPALTGERLPDMQTVRLAGTEALLIATGEGQMLKWDGESAQAALFGSAEALSDAPVNYVETYYNRLFAAGDPAHPSRLYWSCAPGDARTLEDWSQVQDSENVSGGYVEVGTDSDPITGLYALSNQLVICKADSVYRLLGDRPGNYRIYPVNAALARAAHTACVRCGDVLYLLTPDGLYYFDGQNVLRMPDADKAGRFLAGADLSRAAAAACGSTLYFAVREGQGANDALLTYDLARRVYMVRDGFLLCDLAALRGTLYLLDSYGYVCRFGEGETYAGRQIDAYWRTPETDLGQKAAEKRLRELYLRGTGGLLTVSAESGGRTVFFERLMPQHTQETLEAPLTGGGRAFSLRLANEGGSAFCVDGGVELLIDMQRRTL